MPEYAGVMLVLHWCYAAVTLSSQHMLHCVKKIVETARICFLILTPCQTLCFAVLEQTTADEPASPAVVSTTQRNWLEGAQQTDLRTVNIVLAGVDTHSHRLW